MRRILPRDDKYESFRIGPTFIGIRSVLPNLLLMFGTGRDD
jgi:hypothetical protein